jgi:hypothetical protein
MIQHVSGWTLWDSDERAHAILDLGHAISNPVIAGHNEALVQ